MRQFNQSEADLAVCLGDIVDRAELQAELGFLKHIEKVYADFKGPRHYVLGNHCVDTLTKDEFIQHTAKDEPYESFDLGGYHFVILDACFRSDGRPYGRRNFQWTDANLSADELKWLAADLKVTRKPTIVFAHQRLDVSNNHGVKNQGEARHLFEQSGRVAAVFQGHSHRNDLKVINNIPYVTLEAVVEGSDAKKDAYAMLDIHTDGTLRLEGFGSQASRQLGQ